MSVRGCDDCLAMGHIEAVRHNNQAAVWLAHQRIHSPFDPSAVVNFDNTQLHIE
jgi:hypothetical protein